MAEAYPLGVEVTHPSGEFRVKVWRGESGRYLVKVWPIDDGLLQRLAYQDEHRPTVTAVSRIFDVEPTAEALVASYRGKAAADA